MRRFTERRPPVRRKGPPKQSHLVAIVGGSGAGKSWLADRLQLFFGDQVSARLSLDAFYHDRSHVPARRRSLLNFDHPRAIDWKWLECVLVDFSRGRPAPLPCYDFVEHVRACEVCWLEPKPILIVDGLWLLRRPVLRRLFDHRIFIECPPAVRLERRIERDVSQRGRDCGSVRVQFANTVEPMHRRFVAGQRRWADTVLQHPLTSDDVDRLGAKICRALKMEESFAAL